MKRLSILVAVALLIGLPIWADAASISNEDNEVHHFENSGYWQPICKTANRAITADRFESVNPKRLTLPFLRGSYFDSAPTS